MKITKISIVIMFYIDMMNRDHYWLNNKRYKERLQNLLEIRIMFYTYISYETNDEYIINNLCLRINIRSKVNKLLAIMNKIKS